MLPISNPANLVVFGAHMPPLATWLGEFFAASAVSIALTFVMLRWSRRASLARKIQFGSLTCLNEQGTWND